MANSNGNDIPSRLDRVEKILEALVLHQQQMVEDFGREHRQLLTAQVVLTERVDRLAAAQQHTEERLNALIAVVDDIVRRMPPPQ